MSSRGVNKVILIGNLGVDPVLKQTQAGTSVCSFSLATSESWKDKNTGEPQERTEWHRIVLWRGLAEIAAQYLGKGSRIYVEGPLRTRKWTDQNGLDRYTTEIHAREMQMLDGKPGGSGESSPSAQNTTAQQPPQFQEPADFDDDIPF